MANMFTGEGDGDGEGGSKYGGHTFGGQKYGGQTYGGQKLGGQKFGASAPREPVDTGFEGSPVIDTRSWGERHSLGARPGGNTFGGNTFGGNTYGGNTYGASSRDQGPDAPLQTRAGVGVHDQPPAPVDRAGAAGLNEGDPYPPQQIETQPTEPTIKPHEDEAGFRPGPLPKKPGTPGGKPSAGGGGGAGPGKGGRKPLGDQSRTEAYDPTLDRADPRNVAIVDEKGRVNPKTWEDAQKGAIDPTKPGVKTGEAAAKYTNHYTAALQGATEYMTEMFHQKKGDPNQGEGYHAMTFKGVGSPDPAIVNQVFKVVDPNNQLAPKERMELATRAMHDFYQAKGDQKSANKVSAEILQFGNQQAKVFGNQALSAMKTGDRAAAVEAIQKAYDWLPDGFHASTANNKLTITNDKGQTVSSIPLDDKMIANLGTGLATGTLYWDVVQDRAGKPGTFAPPTQQPQQAIATQAPTGAPAPGGAPATPAAPPTGGAPAGAPPAPAAPGARPAAPSAPAPGQTAGAPSAAPPAAPTPPPAPPPAPATPPPPPATTSPPPPPQVVRPAAPAPAAPGPAPAQQAAPPAAVPAPPAPPPAPTQAITPQTPPVLQGPVQPTTTKRPIVEGEPAPPAPPPTQTVTAQPAKTPDQGSGGPPGSPAGPPPPDQTKPDQPKPGDPVWNKDDPDTVPTINGKPAIVRRSTYPVPDDVKEAKQALAKADAEYQKRQDWLAYKQKTTKGTDEYQRTLVQLKDDIEKTHKAATERYKSTVQEHTRLEREHDAQERKDLTPHQLRGTELTDAETIAKAHFGGIVKQGEKSDVFKNSALRLYDTEDKQQPLVDAVSKIQSINPMLSTKKIAELVTTMVTHVGTDDKAKGETMNEQTGAKGSRFLVVGEDLARNPVVAIGHGNSRVVMHVPRDTLNDLKRLKTESFKDVEKKLTDEKNKPKTDYSALVPPLSPTGRKITGAVGEEGARVQKKLQEGAKITKEKLTQGRDWLRKKYEPLDKATE